MNTMTAITDSLARFEPETAPDGGERRRSAVALLLRQEAGSGVEVLMIERSHRSGDPWSGHMAFPGGRVDDTDADSLAAAKRECLEEIGLNVDRHGRYLGRLSDLPTHLRAGRRAMLVTPFVFWVARLPPMVSNEEVADILWVPLAFLADAVNRDSMPWQYEGIDLELPCYHFAGRRIWGLSLGMLDEFLGVAGLARFYSPRPPLS